MMSSNNNLHDRDFNLWLNAQAIALREKNTTAMDFSNLIDEIERRSTRFKIALTTVRCLQDMGASQKRASLSYTQRLIEHILKLKYWHKEQEGASSEETSDACVARERCQRGVAIGSQKF